MKNSPPLTPPVRKDSPDKREAWEIKKESVLLGPLLMRIAPQIGASVIVEPEWGLVGQITFKDGRRSYFRYNTLDLNPVGASDIAKDKSFANFFMESMGYPTIPGKTFFSKDWSEKIGVSGRGIDAAYEYAKELSFPVIVKPNSGSQGGGVALVHNKKQFYRAMRVVFKQDRIAIVQEPVKGKDYRLVVLDDKVISAYERRPLSVVGDGRSTIWQLLEAKQHEFIRLKRDTRIKFDDPRMKDKLARQGMALDSQPPQGVRIQLLDNANLSAGGESVDVTNDLHPDFIRTAVSLTKDMGLRLCGVDVMTEGDISKPPEKYHILEINAAPGLDHYARSGEEQQKLVDQLYLQVLQSIEKQGR